MSSDGIHPEARRVPPYLVLMAIHTLAACMLFLVVFPLFLQIVTQTGQPQSVRAPAVIAAAAATFIMQVCYWTRYRCVPVRAPLHGAAIGHIVMFASRVSFFFSGAVFSAIFFRHVPQLDALPPVGQGLAKALGVLALLFASFCYALELERLGRAIEDGGRRAA